MSGRCSRGRRCSTHLEPFEVFKDVGGWCFDEVPVYARGAAGDDGAGARSASGAVYLIVYVLGYLRLRAARVPRVAAEGGAAGRHGGVLAGQCWGFNSFGEAFFVMNFFHAWQYFGLVWWSERGNLRRRLRLEQAAWGGAAALAVMVGATAAYGVWAECVDSSEQRYALSVTLVVSLMHFWYDGFIWSVRRGEV
jgi:hypothetical protein